MGKGKGGHVFPCVVRHIVPHVVHGPMIAVRPVGMQPGGLRGRIIEAGMAVIILSLR
ncbi:hypothetical protein [Sphingobium sp.]|uniref:hypothetical protein n=1 Tax=Sphingobium sp. TaxID=1912891 RepID=UPI003B3BD76E